MTGPKPEVPDPEQAVPEPKAQRNFTDPESRIMPDGANKGSFVQAFNAQIVVDAEAQVIVAAELTQSPNDARQLVPMAQAIVDNVGKLAETTSADAGYFQRRGCSALRACGTNLLVPPDRLKHGVEPARGSAAPTASPAQQMRHKLASAPGRASPNEGKRSSNRSSGQIRRGARLAASPAAWLRRRARRVSAHRHDPQSAQAGPQRTTSSATDGARRPQTPAPRRYLRSSRSRRLPFRSTLRSQGPRTKERSAALAAPVPTPLGPRPRNDDRRLWPDTLSERGGDVREAEVKCRSCGGPRR
ncbi:MAG: transposase [Myxococcales bacterium]|nr:transposase [Myxococcales bacterium]